MWVLLPGVLTGADTKPALEEKGYRRAAPGWTWSFPRDHGAHPPFETEWWYYVGHLEDARGGLFGFQAAFFRRALAPSVDNESAFAPRDLYFVHFAVTDLRTGEFRFFERLNRTGPGLARAAEGRLDLFNGGWSVVYEPPGHRLRLEEGLFGIDLLLTSPLPPVLHGRGGYAPKGEGRGSLYYSLPRLSAEGVLRAAGESRPVTGTAWMDHEFFSGGMDPALSGWDWMGLRLGEEGELMVYRLRRKDGSSHRASAGTFQDARGAVRRLSAEDFELVPGKTWESSETGARYPVRWRLRVPSLELTAAVWAPVENQELTTQESTRIDYWEGSVVVKGSLRGKKVEGRGYLEMTGYAEPFRFGTEKTPAPEDS